MVDYSKQPVCDTNGNQVNIKGNSSPDKNNKDHDNLLYDHFGNPKFGDAGYFNAIGLPIKPEEIFIDAQGNLVDKRKNPVLDGKDKPI